MAGQDDEAGLLAEDLADELERFQQGVLDFVKFASLAPAERGRIKKDGILPLGAAALPPGGFFHIGLELG